MLIKQSILKDSEIEELKNICITICKKYKVPLIESLVIDGRLRSSNGIYSVYNDLTESKIQLSKKVYLKFGMDQIRKTLKHELAHHICKFKFDDLSHGEKFLNICNEVGGSISYDVATKEYEHLVTESFITPKYHWEYICPKCGASVKRQKKIRRDKQNLYICRQCNTPVSKWKLKDLTKEK